MGRPSARRPGHQVAQPLGGCPTAVSPGRESPRGPERPLGAGIDRNEAVAQRNAFAPDMIDHRVAFVVQESTRVIRASSSSAAVRSIVNCTPGEKCGYASSKAIFQNQAVSPCYRVVAAASVWPSSRSRSMRTMAAAARVAIAELTNRPIAGSEVIAVPARPFHPLASRVRNSGRLDVTSASVRAVASSSVPWTARRRRKRASSLRRADMARVR
jgi:hypothetical protein